jgi:hypothetical protein
MPAPGRETQGRVGGSRVWRRISAKSSIVAASRSACSRSAGRRRRHAGPAQLCPSRSPSRHRPTWAARGQVFPTGQAIASSVRIGKRKVRIVRDAYYTLYLGLSPFDADDPSPTTSLDTDIEDPLETWSPNTRSPDLPVSRVLEAGSSCAGPRVRGPVLRCHSWTHAIKCHHILCPIPPSSYSASRAENTVNKTVPGRRIVRIEGPYSLAVNTTSWLHLVPAPWACPHQVVPRQRHPLWTRVPAHE